MRDKLTNGFVQGLIAGIISSAIDLILVGWFKFGNIRFLDYAGVHIYGFKPGTLGEKFFAQIIQLIFSGFLGIIFVYWIDKVRKMNLWFKGLIFSMGVWFLVYTITILFELKPLNKISLESTLENFLTSLIFGLTIAISYARFAPKIIE